MEGQDEMDYDPQIKERINSIAEAKTNKKLSVIHEDESEGSSSPIKPQDPSGISPFTLKNSSKF